MPLPTAIYSASQVRAIDQHAIEQLRIPGYELMKRAGEGALRILRTRWPMAREIAIVCGGGNNGGDGYVLARFARAAGLSVRVLAVVSPARLQGDARRACDDYLASGGEPRAFDAAGLEGAELIVDALLGLGARGVLRPELLEAIDAMNRHRAPRFSIDLPSGLCADAGHSLGAVVRADATICFIGLKTGLFLGEGPDWCGQIFFDDLEVAVPDEPRFAPRLTRILESEIAAALPRRARASHKGSFGRLLVVGGGEGMSGAARLAGEAALRVGAGLVTVACAPSSAVAIAAGRPELMVHAVANAAALRPFVERADVIAIGPGLGRDAWARQMLETVLAAGAPLVVDADALNLLAEQGSPRRDDWVLTPHPGEAARLLGCGTEDIQRDRLATLEKLQARWGGVVVLKGAGTLVGADGQVAGVCERGNPGMAVPGMGDVLTGAIAGVLAQIGRLWPAARVGVLAHAMAGDAQARLGERGILAGDVAHELRNWINLQ